MINSVILEYQTTIGKVENILRNAKEIGVNTVDYDSVLTQITIEVNEALANFEVIDYSDKENVNKVYKSGTDKARKLLDDLEKYNEYYQAINKCYYVQGTQNALDFNVEELNTTVDDLITLLSVIKKYDGVSSNDLNMFSTLYEVVYDIIKMEYANNGKSRLYDYCKNYESDSVILNKFIVEDIESFKENEYDTSQIDSLVLKMKKDGRTDFLDADLLYLISIQKNLDKYLEELSERLEKISNNLAEGKRRIESLNESKRRNINYKDNYIREDNDYNKRKRRRIILHSIPVGLALTLFVGTNIGMPRLLCGSEYKTDVETYDAQTNRTIPTEEYRSKILTSYGKQLTDITTINVTSPWKLRKYKDDNKTFYEREISSTKIIGIDYDDLSEYLELDLGKIKSSTEYSVVVERKDALTGEDQYEDSIYKVVKEHQYPTDSRPAKMSFGEILGSILVSILIDIMIIMLSELFLMNSDYGVLDSIGILIDELRWFKARRTDVSNYVERIKLLSEDIDKVYKESIESAKEYEALKEKPEYKILIKEFNRKKSIIESYIAELSASNGMTLSKSRK